MSISRSLHGLAALLTVLLALGHVFGTPFAETVPNSDMPEYLRWLGYFAHHVGTVALIAISAAWAYAALRPPQVAVAVLADSMAAGLATLGLGIALFGSPALWSTPAPWAFALLAAVGISDTAIEIRGSAT